MLIVSALLVLVVVAVSGQVQQILFPDHPATAPFLENNRREPAYQHNVAYHPEYRPPAMPKILVFMSKIRKMFLNWTADYVICCRKSQVLISIQIFIVIQIFPILTVERGGSVNEIKNERHFTHVYKLIYIWKIQTNHCVIIKIVSHLLAFTFFFFLLDIALQFESCVIILGAGKSRGKQYMRTNTATQPIYFIVRSGALNQMRPDCSWLSTVSEKKGKTFVITLLSLYCVRYIIATK